MHYKKYEVHSPLFALRNPKLSAQVLATCGPAARKALLPQPPRESQPPKS